jgi:hypothetical protein
VPHAVDCARRDNGAGGLCDIQDACLSDPDCNGFLPCLTAECKSAFLPDPECRLTCGNRFPDGSRGFYQSVGNRYFDACVPECDAGRQWSCNMPPVWPPPSGDFAAVTLRSGNTLLAGTADASAADSLPLHVRACPLTAPACAVPAGEAEFAVGAAATFSLPQGRDPFYYFEITNPNRSAPNTLLLATWAPLVGDATVFLPLVPTDAVAVLTAAETRFGPGRAFVRRVSGRNIWILYRFDDDHVFAMTTRGTPLPS